MELHRQTSLSTAALALLVHRRGVRRDSAAIWLQQPYYLCPQYPL